MQRGSEPGTGNLGGVEDGHPAPPHPAGGAGGKGRDEIGRDGEDRADDVGRIDPVGLHQGVQQFLGGREDLIGLVAVHGGGAAESLQAERSSACPWPTI